MNSVVSWSSHNFQKLLCLYLARVLALEQFRKVDWSVDRCKCAINVPIGGMRAVFEPEDSTNGVRRVNESLGTDVMIATAHTSLCPLDPTRVFTESERGSS